MQATFFYKLEKKLGWKSVGSYWAGTRTNYTFALVLNAEPPVLTVIRVDTKKIQVHWILLKLIGYIGLQDSNLGHTKFFLWTSSFYQLLSHKYRGYSPIFGQDKVLRAR